MTFFAEATGQTPKDELSALLGRLDEIRAHNKLKDYKPYQFQVDFHNATGPNGKPARQKALQAANKTGKSYCGAREATFHATGQYPDWYQGVRFTKPTIGLVASVTAPLTRDVAQLELLGDQGIGVDWLGTGSIPEKLIGQIRNKPGVPGAVDSVAVKHVSGGWSRIMFQSYEAGFQKFQGFHTHWVWADEEPPLPIWEQMLRSGFATNGIAFLTYTPEQGMTEVVHGFMYEPTNQQAVVGATWDDVASEKGGHMTPEMRESFLSAIPENKRDMRTKGLPAMGTGLVFQVDDDDLTYDPFDYPDHWPRIVGFDFGSDHPFAVVWMAWDRDNDAVFIYDCHKESRATLATQASIINRRGTWIPVVWPHDVNQADRQSGRPFSDIFRTDYNVNMLPNHFTNPPAPGQKEGQGGFGIEVGLMAMENAMMEGRFKVAKHLSKWFEEKNMYIRVDGRVVKKRDDLMSASRYAYMSLRFAQIRPPRVPKRRRVSHRPMRNW